MQLPEPMLTYCQLDPHEQTSVKFDTPIFIQEIFIQENAFESVWKMSTIFASTSMCY